VQRTLGLAPARSAADATDAPDQTDGPATSIDIDDATVVEPAQHLSGGAEIGTASDIALSPAQPARPATPPGSAAPFLAVSRLAAADVPGTGSGPSLAMTSFATTAPAALRTAGATPVAVQRASQTIAAPPAASVSRMVLPVAPTTPARRSEGGPFDGASDGTTRSGAAGWSAGAGAGPVVQTAVDPDSTPPAEPPGETSSAPPAGGAGAAGAAAAAGAGGIDTSPAGIETLAARLYGPLARRLKAELLLDRERRGIRIDGI